MSTESTGTSLAIKLFKATVIPAIFVVLVELLARALNLQAGFFLFPTSNNCLQRSGLLLMEFRPNCNGLSSGTPLRTNSLGLRGDELRDDGSHRIVTVGDSCTWGWKVNQDESYPEVLQQLLDQRADGQRYQVINAGAPGYTSYQGLLILRERLLALQPAIVIIGFGFNDTFKNGDVEVQLMRTQRLLPVILFDDFLLQRSTLYRWLRWQLHQRAPESLPARVSPAHYKRNLIEMVSLARAHGARVLLLSFFKPVRRPMPYATELRQVAAEMNLPLITYHGPLIDVVHPSAAGYRVLASEVLDALEKEGYVH